MSYDKAFTDALQAVWGKGFLSPGGPAAVAAFLAGCDLAGKRVLDVGSGLGGVELLLVRDHGAAGVTGIDVDPWLIATSREMIAGEGEAALITFVQVEPGSLPFDDATFDAVVSKDAMIHIADKPALYAEVLRVLRPGGRFAASDWLFGPGAEGSAEFQAWMPGNPLGFAFTTPEEALAALQGAGFAAAYVTDRSGPVAAIFATEFDQLQGALGAELARLHGAAMADDRREGARLRLAAVHAGQLRPCHVGGMRPA